MASPRGFLVASGLVLAGLGLGWGMHGWATPNAGAQSLDEEFSPEARDKMFESLEREVAALEQHGNVLKTVVKLVSPSVVHIEAKKRSEGGKRLSKGQSIDEAGSGALIGYNGKYYVLTNRHVVKDASLADIGIHLNDGRELHPSHLWSDPDTDIAVALLDAPDLIPARLGNSDKVEIGDFVLACGSPFGLSNSVSYGIISAKGRRDLQLGDDGVKFQDFMQTDAAINPGNSGGPLMNLRGEVIGINTAIASNSGGNEGIGFSIPINMVMVIARQLVEHGSVSRAYLGVTLDRKFSPATAAQLGLPRVQGARITGLTPNSPATDAQLRNDDVILEFGGIRIQDDNHLVNLVSLTEVDKEVPIVVFRDRRRITILVKVGDRRKFDKPKLSMAEPPSPAPIEAKPQDLALGQVEVWDIDELGISVARLTPIIARRLRMPENQTGLIVAEIDPLGPAAGQVRQGELLSSIDRRPIKKVEDIDEALAHLDPAQSLRVALLSKDAESANSTGTTRTVMIKPLATVVK